MPMIGSGAIAHAPARAGGATLERKHGSASEGGRQVSESQCSHITAVSGVGADQGWQEAWTPSSKEPTHLTRVQQQAGVARVGRQMREGGIAGEQGVQHRHLWRQTLPPVSSRQAAGGDPQFQSTAQRVCFDGWLAGVAAHRCRHQRARQPGPVKVDLRDCEVGGS
jgi:hypothetical protein